MAADFDSTLAAAVKDPGVTVVHFWAPWCPNCKAELADGKWADFLAKNSQVHFIFVTIWNDQEGVDVLTKYGLGPQPNFAHYLHPNHSRKREDKVGSVLGLPVTWIPTTWVFKEGKLRYALNYGELHFPILQQLIEDSSNAWKH